VLVAAGATLYYFGRREAATKPASHADLRLTVGASSRTVVTVVETTF
jgi:hypothetical protein